MSDWAGQHPVAELAAYRELTPEQRQVIHAHLATCGECRAQFEAFNRQDALLAGLPRLTPRTRAFQVSRPSGGWVWLARLGDAMAVGGLATLTAAAAIIVRAMATAPTLTGSAPLVPGLPLTLPPDLPARVNPWLLAAPWLGGAVSAVGLLLALGQRNRVWTFLGIALAVLLLFTYVPPLSAMPNPAGLAWRVTGSYSYDPNLPFKNLFVLAGDPTAKLRPYLDQLVGQVGLDPLDPVRPLARYRFERVSVWRGDKRAVLVSTRFVYADGSNRVYDVPLFNPMGDVYLQGWHDDGLARLRTQHLALPGQPFATETDPVSLGDPVRLPLSPQADGLDAVNPAHWLWLSNRLQRLVWSPQGDAFLLTEQSRSESRQLWLAPLDGTAPQPVTRGGSVFEYGWSPDGQFIVYTAPGEWQVSASARGEVAYLVVVRRGALERPVARRALNNISLPGLTAQGAWYAQDGALWLMDYASGDSIRVTDLPDLGRATVAPLTYWPLAVSPDGGRVAYGCGLDLCLKGVEGGPPRRLEASGVRAIAWDANGARLAAVSLDDNNLGPVRLLIVSREGELQQSVDIAPRDAADPPQWTPDGRIVFVQTFPMGGRRILTVVADTGQVLDLSREHWDAYFALSPDGQSLLLNNGRGGFWLAPVERRPVPSTS